MSGPSLTSTSGEDMCLEMFETARGPAVCRRHEDHPSIAEDGIGHSFTHLDIAGVMNTKVAAQVRELLEKQLQTVLEALEKSEDYESAGYYGAQVRRALGLPAVE